MSNAWHKKRLRAEQRFRWYGRLALGVAVLILAFIIVTLLLRGSHGFMQTQIRIPISYDAKLLELEEGQPLASIPISSFNKLMQQSLKTMFPEQKNTRELFSLVSSMSGAAVKQQLLQHEDWLGQTVELWLAADSKVDLHIKHRKDAAHLSSLSESQALMMDRLASESRVRTVFNETFFTSGDSRSPERAGFLGAINGSILTLLACFSLAFPIGVMTAVYLQEFARPGKFIDLIEVNINNLAAVPSIVFGLLGLAVYINLMGMPRSAPLVGGLTLALMILPVIIISTRASLASIPPSIRDAARALGATPVQVVWHHVLPLSMPGIMTGTILGMARAIGETAPLLMIGMVAFVADVPTSFTDSATVMPVQVYLWASSPEVGFSEKTAAGILVLLVLLMAMNMLAIFLRRRFEVRW